MTDLIFEGDVRPHIQERLDLDEVPSGGVSRVLVEVAHDGLGAPIYLPLLVVKGKRPGPTFGITAAVHGNELNGIPVVHRLFDRLEPGKVKGTVVAVVVVNVPGYLANQRQFTDGTDLNHIMPGKPDGTVAEVYAHRLMNRVVQKFDFLVDIHTASFGNVNSLYVRADLTDNTAARMAYLLRPQIILNNPPSDRTLRGSASELGIPAITVEVGNPQRFKPEFIRTTLRGVRRILAEVGMVARRPAPESAAPILCTRSHWLYSDHGGLLEVFPAVTDLLEKGDVIARVSNVFGDVVREYQASEPGVVIGKSVNPVAQTGARILHLGTPAPLGTYPVPEPLPGRREPKPDRL